MTSFEYTPLYYNEPTQVRFFDWRISKWVGGIAFHKYIFNGRYCELLLIEDVVQNAINQNIHWDEVIVELSWKPIDTIIWVDN